MLISGQVWGEVPGPESAFKGGCLITAGVLQIRWLGLEWMLHFQAMAVCVCLWLIVLMSVSIILTFHKFIVLLNLME